MSTHTSASHWQLKTSIRERILSQAVVLTTFTVVVLSTLSFIVARSIMERSVQAQLSAIASAAEGALESSVRIARERTARLASHRIVQQLTEGGSADMAVLLQEAQQERQAVVIMESLTLYDAGGNVIQTVGATQDDRVAAPEKFGVHPILTGDGWNWYDISVPVYGPSGSEEGILTARFGTRSVVSQLLIAAAALGTSAQVVMGTEEEGQLLVIHPGTTMEDQYLLRLDTKRDAGARNLALMQALREQEGVVRSQDMQGREVFAAYRYLPSLGWGLEISVERAEALQEVKALSKALGGIGMLLIILAVILASLLARQLTGPIAEMMRKVRSLQPGDWTMRRTIHTGDEVEMFDRIVVDLAGRLEQVYGAQEEEIRKRTEELGRQYALDRAILEHIPQGVLSVDHAGIVTGANPAAVHMLLAQESLMGRSALKALTLCARKGGDIMDSHPLHACLQHGETVASPPNVHWNLQRPDGTLLPVSLVATPLLQENGAQAGAVVVFEDVTEARRLDYLKSEFISLASHQLRTPISIIRWYLELLNDQRRNFNADQKSYLHEMQEALRRMVALLTSLLNASHMEGNNLEPDLQKTDLARLLEDMKQDYQPVAEEAGMRLGIVVPHESVYLQTDPVLLRIVLQNLISNAFKYATKGSTVRVRLDASKQQVTLAVEDTGMGIPATEQKRVFEKFFRASNVRKLDTDGTGLGLYITRSIVERLGGTIAFESEENRRTVFTVVFPVER